MYATPLPSLRVLRDHTPQTPPRSYSKIPSRCACLRTQLSPSTRAKHTAATIRAVELRTHDGNRPDGPTKRQPLAPTALARNAQAASVHLATALSTLRLSHHSLTAALALIAAAALA